MASRIDVSIEHRGTPPDDTAKHPNTCPRCHSHYRDEELEQTLSRDLDDPSYARRLASASLSPALILLSSALALRSASRSLALILLSTSTFCIPFDSKV
jgi:hypothetical protein